LFFNAHQLIHSISGSLHSIVCIVLPFMSLFHFIATPSFLIFQPLSRSVNALVLHLHAFFHNSKNHSYTHAFLQSVVHLLLHVFIHSIPQFVLAIDFAIFSHHELIHRFMALFVHDPTQMKKNKNP
jgi:hypothetical protein